MSLNLHFINLDELMLSDASSSRHPTPLSPPRSTQPLPVLAPTLYNYMNPVTKQLITTSLPPDHPEMICLQSGKHVTETKYGLLGES